jgi:transposase
MVYPTDVLTNTQIAFLATHLPEPKAETGRPAYTNSQLLPGILRVLRSGCRWRDLDLPGYPSGITHWRRLRFWMRNESLKVIFLVLSKLYIRHERLQSLKRLSLDGTFIPSYEFADTTAYAGKYRKTGVKLSTLVDANGIPLSFAFATGSTHDLNLAIETMVQMPTEGYLVQRRVLLADMAYDSFLFRLFLKDHGTEPYITRRRKTLVKLFFEDHYPSDPQLAKKRFVVERFHAWMKSNRRLRIRYDYSLLSFKAFVYLSAIVLCVRQVVA